VPLLWSRDSNQVVNDAVLNTLIQGSVPAGRLATNGALVRVVAFGTIVAATVAPTWFLGISVGATQLWSAITAAYALSATVRSWRLEFDLVRRTAATAAMGGVWSLNNSAALPVQGVGVIATAPQGGPIGSPIVDSAVDWTIAQDVSIAVQQSAAGGNLFTIRGCYGEFLTP
jgi:hypothetical protein